jgi:hypothetical protein
MDHRASLELAAGAALDDLEPAERADLDAHLRGCPPCRAAARDLVDVSAALALAAPTRVPPASLRGGVMAAIAAVDRPHAELAAALAGPVPAAAVPTPAGAPAARAEVVDLASLRRERTLYRRLAFAGLAAAAVLAVAVAGLGASLAGARTDYDTAASERDAAVARLAASDAAMAVVIAPDHATAMLEPEPMAGNASVYVVYRPGTTDAWLMAGDLPATPAGKVYQLWSADDRGVHALTTFTCDGVDPCLAPYGVDLASAAATMITLEPAGGAAGEPGPQVAFGELHG